MHVRSSGHPNAHPHRASAPDSVHPRPRRRHTAPPLPLSPPSHSPTHPPTRPPARPPSSPRRTSSKRSCRPIVRAAASWKMLSWRRASSQIWTATPSTRQTPRHYWPPSSSPPEVRRLTGADSMRGGWAMPRTHTPSRWYTCALLCACAEGMHARPYVHARAHLRVRGGTASRPPPPTPKNHRGSRSQMTSWATLSAGSKAKVAVTGRKPSNQSWSWRWRSQSRVSRRRTAPHHRQRHRHQLHHQHQHQHQHQNQYQNQHQHGRQHRQQQHVHSQRLPGPPPRRKSHESRLEPEAAAPRRRTKAAPRRLTLT